MAVLGATSLPDTQHIGHFSAAEADSNGHPVEWMPISFGDVDRKTQHRLVKRPVRGDTTRVVRAVSDGGAAGLGQAVRLDSRQHPILTWQWKVSAVLETGNAREKDGDDYPARIYVTFDYDPSSFGVFDRIKYEALQALG